MSRAATALSGDTSLPWDSDLSAQHQAHMERMEGEGHRVMAAAVRDLDPDDFDPHGDLLGYVALNYPDLSVAVLGRGAHFIFTPVSP